MRRVLSVFLAAVVLLAGSARLPVAEASGSWQPPAAIVRWATRGLTYQRNSSADVRFGYLGAYPSWELDLGVSASQPVTIDNRIYHLAGNKLWEIDLAKLDTINPDPNTNPPIRVIRDNVNNCVRGTDGKNVCPGYNPATDAPEKGIRPSTSGITYASVNGVGVLYYGTGSNEVCGTRLVEVDGYFPTRCFALGGDQPIASTPLVFTIGTSSGIADVVVIGDKAGGLWAIQGLSGFGPLYGKRYDVGAAWVTPSPAATGVTGEFIWGADGVGNWQGYGVYGKFRVSPADPATGTVADH